MLNVRHVADRISGHGLAVFVIHAPLVNIPDAERVEGEVTMGLVGTTALPAPETPQDLPDAHGVAFGGTDERREPRVDLEGARVAELHCHKRLITPNPVLIYLANRLTSRGDEHSSHDLVVARFACSQGIAGVI